MGEELWINAQMRGYVDIVTYGDSEIDSEMVISRHGGGEIDVELLVQPSGYMRGYIDIIGFGENDLESEIVVQQKDFMELESMISIENKYRDNDLDTEMVISREDRNDLDVEIFLKPNALMRGYVDIVEPVKRILKIYPTKDSTVRESAPIINYGKSGQMMAGKEGLNKKLISYLGFYLEWPEDLDELISAKLVLNKEYLTEKLFFMGIHEVSDEWLEDYITWGYRPTNETYINQFVIPKEVGRVDVDLKSYVEAWSKVGGSKSFTLHPRNYDFSDLTTFSTKESSNPPCIEITYYETSKSANAMSIDTEMVVAIRQDRDLTTELEVVNDFTYTELDSEIVIVKNESTSDLATSIEVCERGSVELDLDLELERKDIECEIDTSIIVPYINDLDSEIELEEKSSGGELNSEIIVKAFDSVDLDSEITLENKGALEDLGVEIVVQQGEYVELDSEISIEIKAISEELDVEITVQQSEYNDLDTEITLVNKPIVNDLYTEVTVRKFVSTDLDTEFILDRKEQYSDLDMELIVKSTDYSNLDTEIDVPKVDAEEDIDIEMIVPYTSDLAGELELERKDIDSDINTSITITMKEMQSDLDGDMVVRAFWADEVDCSIIIERSFEIDVEMEVVDAGGDYAFIM